jgi:hypothetical protein
MAAALECGVPLANPSLAEYAHLFPATANDLWCRYPVVDGLVAPSRRRRMLLAKALRWGVWALSIVSLDRILPLRIKRLRGSEYCNMRRDGFRALATSGQPLFLQGYMFRSDPLPSEHMDTIRRHFAIGPEHRSNVDELMARLRARGDVVIGLHIRRGDYATWQQGRYFYSFAQYAEILRRVAEQLSGRRVVFLVCGDEKFDEDDFRGLDVHPGTGHIIEDMYALAETDILIGPPSTYSEWAAFYGQKPRVVLERAELETDVAALLDPAG